MSYPFVLITKYLTQEGASHSTVKQFQTYDDALYHIYRDHFCYKGLVQYCGDEDRLREVVETAGKKLPKKELNFPVLYDTSTGKVLMQNGDRHLRKRVVKFSIKTIDELC